MDKMSDSAKQINDLYKKATYFDEYGGSVLLFILLTIILFVAHSYTVVMSNIKPIKDDWINQRCKPNNIPFAGLINKPAGMSVSDYTQQNFTHCMQNILISITGFAVQPITYATSILNNVFMELAKGLEFMNHMMANIRLSIGTLGSNVMTRIANVMVPLQHIMIVIKDLMEKIKGLFTAGLYTSLGTYFALQSFLGAIAEILIMILIVLAILIIGFWLIPFTWPFAITMTAIFISVSIPLAIMLAFMSEVLHVNIEGSIPKVPSKPNICFDKNTQFLMNDGTYKKIIDIQCSDYLHGKILVTAKLQLDASNAIMYNLDNIIVSGSHPVKYNGKWIKMSEHPDATQIINYNEPFIYCLNTSSKQIILKNYIFSDWDEIYETEIDILKKIITKMRNDENEPNINFINTLWIHTYLDGGFAEITNIVLANGLTREIKDVKIGDILEHGEIVYGIVEIDGTMVEYQEKFYLGPDKIVEGGPNLQLCEKELDNITYFSESIKKRDKLYHLLTDCGTFYIDGIKYCHYNSTLENFLD